jgi:hypothetical protein
MDKLETLAQSIKDFGSLNHVERIRFFAWHVQTQEKRDVFTAADIRRGYERCDLQLPSAIGPFLNDLHKRKELIRTPNGFRLERQAREALDTRYNRYLRTPSAVHVDELLAGLPATLHDTAERAYLDEALVCYRNGAFRAAIVMTWNVAYDHLCQYVLTTNLSEFNAQLPRSFPRADLQIIKKRDDFTELKESQVLQVCKSAGIISGPVYDVAKEKLTRRNIAAHPSGVHILQPTAEEFIKDIVVNVIRKIG